MKRMLLNHVRGAAAALSALALLACGEQLEADYAGPNLLTLTAAVELPPGVADEELVPVLAFPEDNGVFRLVDVELDGEFPNRFTLRTDQPPPQSVMDLYTWFFGPKVGRFAMAQVAVVPRDHPETFQHRAAYALSSDCEELLCYEVSERSCYLEEGEELTNLDLDTWDDDNCVTETRRCDFPVDLAEDQDYSTCELIEHEGDASIAGDVSRRFYGVAQEIAILYLPEPAPTASFVGLTFGNGGPVPAGYHIIERPEPGAYVDEDPEVEVCQDEAMVHAFERFSREQPDSSCRNEGDGEAVNLVCDERSDWHQWFGDYYIPAIAERGCYLGGAARVIDGDAEFDITLGPPEYGL